MIKVRTDKYKKIKKKNLIGKQKTKKIVLKVYFLRFYNIFSMSQCYQNYSSIRKCLAIVRSKYTAQTIKKYTKVTYLKQYLEIIK